MAVLRSGNTPGNIFLQLVCNIVALQVETHCCTCFHVCNQLVSQQNAGLQVEVACCSKKTRVLLSATNSNFAAGITTVATTYLAANLNSTLVIGRREARQIK